MTLPPASVRGNPNGSRQCTQNDRREAERGRRRLNQRKPSTEHVPGIQFRARRLRRLQETCVSHPFLGTSTLASASPSVVYLRWIGTDGSFLPTAGASVLPTAPRHLDERYLAPMAFAALAPAPCVQTQHCSQEDDIDTSVAEKLDRFLLGLTAASHPTYRHDSLYTPSSSLRPRRRNRIVDTHIVPYLQYCTRSL